MKKQQFQLSGEAFDRIAANTRLRKKTRSMARAVIVGQSTHTAVAAANDVTRARVSLAVKVIEDAYNKLAGEIPGMVRVSVDLPKGLANELADFSVAIKGCGESRLVESAVKQVVAAIESAKSKLSY